MKKNLRLFLVATATVGICGITGCDKHQERFEDPPWLGGSSIETLEKRGNYTIFLNLMEKANYTDAITKQLFTLFVPDDDAFNAYFQSIGKSSVDDLSKDEAVQLFTLHVLRNPRSRYQLIYEYVWNEFQVPKGEYAALFNRKITPSTSIPYEETIRYLPGRVGEKVLIYTEPKNVSLWTAEYFHDYGGAEDGSDYLFMYPGSTWELNYPPNLKGTNWHNAMVIPNPEIPDEMEVRTSSGFIYFLDRVVPPIPSIEEYLRAPANENRFGLYYDILQRFAAYGNQDVDEQKRVLYRKSYDLVFNLADEWGPERPPLPKRVYSAFIPNNIALQAYLDNTVLKYYPSIDSVPRVTLYYILQTQLSAALAIISKIEKTYFNAFGDPTEISRADIVSAYMCSNGPVYETNRVLEPNVFTCVPGLLFIDKNYSTLLFLLNQANMLTSLSNPDADVTLFAATNDKLEEYGVRYNATNSVVESRGPVDGKWATMNTTEMTTFAQDQIYKGVISDLNSEGGFAEMTSGNFIHYANNQIEAAENQRLGQLSTVQEVMENERNGFLIKVDNPIESRVVMGKILTGDLADTSLSDFAQLLIDTRMLDAKYKDPITKENIPNLKFLSSSKYWTAFIPTNAAMAEARAAGLVPPTTEVDSITSFIMYHFVINNVIFDDGKDSGIFETNRTYKDPVDGKTVLNSTIEIINSPGSLVIKDLSGQLINVDHTSANILARKGVVHKINSVLKYY
jgi:uncharacterized surface protein with fasciclin (FAS1) repeats